MPRQLNVLLDLSAFAISPVCAFLCRGHLFPFELVVFGFLCSASFYTMYTLKPVLKEHMPLKALRSASFDAPSLAIGSSASELEWTKH